MRISFKQFLNEEDQEDQVHEFVSDAALEFVQHCKQFPDINHPLYRLSGSSWSGGHNHKLKTRAPRTRQSRSIGGTADEQAFLFAQPGWEGYPSRRQSIFCSTDKDFEIDEPTDDGSNLLMIFPFDGVKIAVLPEKDLNTMNILRGVDGKAFGTIGGLFDVIDTAYNFFRDTDLDHADDNWDRLKIIKKTFNKGGKFDPEANGNDELADKYAEIEREQEYTAKYLKLAATAIPEKLTPEAIGVKLVTSAGLDLPGDTRECWFSGKYLSVPYRYYEEFKQAVKELR